MFAMKKSLFLKIGAAVPFIVGLIGIVCAFLSIIFRSDDSILWFGGSQSFSMQQLWHRPVLHIASDLLSLHLPFFALGPHLCGAAGFLFIADAIDRKRRWALLVLFCVITVAGINDTMGAYIYFLNTGDKGFVVPLVATSLGTCGLMLFRDAFIEPQRTFSQKVLRTPPGIIYDVGRRWAIVMTCTMAILWLLGYFTFFMPGYLLFTDKSSSFFGLVDVPSLNWQVMRSTTTHSSDEFIVEKSDALYGFSVMTAQMAWAAGSVGFGIAPAMASIYGLTDADPFIRGRCIMFLAYVTLCVFVNGFMLHFGVPSSYVKSPVGDELHGYVYHLQLVYGLGLAVAVGVMMYGHSVGKVFKDPVKSS